MSLNDDNVTKLIFLQRAKKYYNNVEENVQNTFGSNTYALLNTVSTFGFCETVKNMVHRGQVWNRAHWRE